MKRQSGMPPAMILCGGQGTRLRDVTEILPKPMVLVGPYPMVWHIMKIYSTYGVRRFILCLGYKKEVFSDYFLNYRARTGDITVTLGPRPAVVYHRRASDEDWEITLADTGENALTGARVYRASKYLRASEAEFFLTYGDGVADIDIAALLAAHHRSGKMITVTAVHPASRFGEMEIGEDGAVRSFHEKPQTAAGFINGGFMVVRREFIDGYLSDDDRLTLEEEPMRNAARDGNMASFTHEGFWQCMDTAREHKLLNELWASGVAPWTRGWQRCRR